MAAVVLLLSIVFVDVTTSQFPSTTPQYCYLHPSECASKGGQKRQLEKVGSLSHGVSFAVAMIILHRTSILFVQVLHFHLAS